MKYYTYVEPEDDGITPVVRTLSEAQILAIYWDSWYGIMTSHLTKEIFWNNFNPSVCIEDWCSVHWAVETDKDGNEITEGS